MFWANGLIMLIGANGETPLEVLFKTITVFFTVGSKNKIKFIKNNLHYI